MTTDLIIRTFEMIDVAKELGSQLVINRAITLEDKIIEYLNKTRKFNKTKKEIRVLYSEKLYNER